ncbi:hypothetical protein HOI26_00740 [Candidatus Woesearchaeota archaeon]|jgi:hypothetical protein|nr:hypothetical protein [Candidatus Woesearchaeota archaeon]MBT5739601.1 hypothetical protein [Candidatus Woesearchaeota archaeon]
MAFSKTFPKTTPGSNYPTWEEITLTNEEESLAAEKCKQENFKVLDHALREARALAIKHSLNESENVVRLAVALFEKRASHEIFFKENKAKEKFDEKFK